MGQEGVCYANNAVKSCTSLQERKDSVEILRAGLTNIEALTTKAYPSARGMNERFRHIRHELYNVSLVSLHSPTLLTHLIFPGRSQRIFLPTLPVSICTFTAHHLLDHTFIANANDLSAVFRYVMEDLERLVEGVSLFVDWWDDVKVKLAELERVLPQVTVDGECTFRILTVTERWTGVRNEYVSYLSEVIHS